MTDVIVSALILDAAALFVIGFHHAVLLFVAKVEWSVAKMLLLVAKVWLLKESPMVVVGGMDGC